MELQPELLCSSLSARAVPGSGSVELSLPAEGEGTQDSGRSGKWIRCDKNHHKPFSLLFGFLSQFGGS